MLSERIVFSQLLAFLPRHELNKCVALIRKELGIERNLYEILQILSTAPFEQVPLCQLLTENATQYGNGDSPNQLDLFDLQPDSSGSGCI